MPSFIDKLRELLGGRGRSAAPDDLSRRTDDEPGATTGLDRPFPEAPPASTD